MLKTLKYNVVTALIIGLVVPLGVSSAPQQSPSNNPTVSGSRIVVTALPPIANIASFAQNTTCGHVVTLTTTLVQNESVVNLHQGAACTIQLSVAAPSSPEYLAVLDQVDERLVTVTQQAVSVASAKVAHHPQTTEETIITPNTSTARPEVLQIATTSNPTTNKKSGSFIFPYTRSLQQLQIMRC